MEIWLAKAAGKKDSIATKAPPSSEPKLDTTLVKGLSVLNVLAEADTPLGISAISEMLGLGKSNVHRTLNTLVELQFVRKDPNTRQYMPTLKLWEMGSFVAERNILNRVSRSVVRDMFAELNETVYVSILSGVDILYLDLIPAAHGTNVRPRQGQRVPAVFPASGRVLLAYQSNPALLVDRSIAVTPQAATLDRDALLAHLTQIRNDGFAITVNGWTNGVSSLAVPVRQSNTQPVAALGVGVLSSKYTQKQLRQFLPKLQSYSERISEMIGPVSGFN